MKCVEAERVSSGWVSQKTWVTKEYRFYIQLEDKPLGSCFGKKEDVNTTFWGQEYLFHTP